MPLRRRQSCAGRVWRSSEAPAGRARSRRLAAISSMVLASHTVQVTNEAIARPIITAFTTMSACMYMPQGLRSRGSVATSIDCSGGCSCAAARSAASKTMIESP